VRIARASARAVAHQAEAQRHHLSQRPLEPAPPVLDAVDEALTHHRRALGRASGSVRRQVVQGGLRDRGERDDVILDRHPQAGQVNRPRLPHAGALRELPHRARVRRENLGVVDLVAVLVLVRQADRRPLTERLIRGDPDPAEHLVVDPVQQIQVRLVLPDTATVLEPHHRHRVSAAQRVDRPRSLAVQVPVRLARPRPDEHIDQATRQVHVRPALARPLVPVQLQRRNHPARRRIMRRDDLTRVLRRHQRHIPALERPHDRVPVTEGEGVLEHLRHHRREVVDQRHLRGSLVPVPVILRRRRPPQRDRPIHHRRHGQVSEVRPRLPHERQHRVTPLIRRHRQRRLTPQIIRQQIQARTAATEPRRLPRPRRRQRIRRRQTQRRRTHPRHRLTHTPRPQPLLQLHQPPPRDCAASACQSARRHHPPG
jgi:hypothetical protein